MKPMTLRPSSRNPCTRRRTAASAASWPKKATQVMEEWLQAAGPDIAKRCRLPTALSIHAEGERFFHRLCKVSLCSRSLAFRDATARRGGQLFWGTCEYGSPVACMGDHVGAIDRI